MLDNKGFDLWADGYDKSVELSEVKKMLNIHLQVIKMF